MGETTPLLLRTNGSSYHLSTPLRAYHPPALLLRQRMLLAVRATIAVYLSITFSLDMLHRILYTHRGKQFVFEASNVSLMIQIVYYWFTTLCALRNCWEPSYRLPYEEQGNSDFVAERQVALLAPMLDRSDSRSSSVFSILHTASVTFPFVTSIVYWLVLHPSRSIFDHARKGGNFNHFVLISTTVLNSVIAFVEVMVLSSGRMQKDLATQVAGVTAIYLFYGIWTVIGRFITGEYVSKYFDPDSAGWMGVATTDITVLSLTIITFFAQRGLYSLRESMIWKAEFDQQGHCDRLTVRWGQFHQGPHPLQRNKSIVEFRC
ncbi:hypothetical protein BDR22DRAFT_247878 [Usnea florida]